MKKFLLLLLLVAIVGGLAYFLNSKPNTNVSPQAKQVKAKFAILSDTHSDSDSTRQALKEAQERGAEFIADTGDLTTVGSIQELTKAKEDFDTIDLSYYLVPGDHDIYNSAGTANFEKIIGRPYYSTDKDSVHMVFLDTSDTSLGIYDTQLAWLENDLEANKNKPILMFMHLPLYHPISPRTIWEKGGNNQSVKKQTEEVITLLKRYHVLATFAGDHHLSSDYTEPTSGVKMYIVGAVTKDRNLQKPRFDMVTVYEDNSVSVEEVVI